jgi:hypothetical protein
MLAVQFHEAAAAAKNTHAVDELARQTWRAYEEGHLADAEAEAVSEALVARRRALAAGQGIPAPKTVFAALRPARSPPRSPDRRRSIERRRRQAANGVVPSKIAAGFTQGESAVLSVIGRQCQRGGACTLHIDAIAALAGCSRSLVKNALRAARAGGLLMVKERRIPGRKSGTNVVTVISREWSAWLRLGMIGGRNLTSTPDSNKKEGKSEPLRGSSLVESGRPNRPERGLRGGEAAPPAHIDPSPRGRRER